MLQTLLLGACMASLGICFWVANWTNKSKKVKEEETLIDSAPPEIKEAFWNFASDLLSKENKVLSEIEIVSLDSIRDVPFEDGQFRYFLVDFLLTPALDAAAEILAEAGQEVPKPKSFRGRIVLLYFKDKDGECTEITFIPEERARNQGYNAYIDSRYGALKDLIPSEVYKINLAGQEIKLWDNIAGLEIQGFTKTRVKAKDEYAKYGQFIDIYENEDIEFSVWVQFEKKKEIIVAIKLKTYKGEVPSGVRVGYTVPQLKSAYGELSFLELFECIGPAYGYIPDDETNNFIAFKVQDNIVTEIIVQDGLSDRRFTHRDGYIDQDVPWTSVDNSEKFTEKYARGLYLGQNKADLEPRQVFNNFVAKTFELGSVIEKGVWREDIANESIRFYVICETSDNDGFGKLYGEAELCRIGIDSLTMDHKIWIVDRYRTQKKGI